jgi:chemotaxis-related protein WspB
MLWLLFNLGKDRYAIEARRVIEVVPLVTLKQLPRVPDYVAGILNYRGTPVPVIDLTQLCQDRPSAVRMSTRIMLIEYLPAEAVTPRSHLLGLIAEHATETVLISREAFIPAGIGSDEAPYLGDVVNDEHGMIQLLLIDKLLTDAVQPLLFATDATRPVATVAGEATP